MNVRLIGLVAVLGAATLLKLFDESKPEVSVALVSPVESYASEGELVSALRGNIAVEQVDASPRPPLPWPVYRDPFLSDPPITGEEKPQTVARTTETPVAQPLPTPVPVQTQRPRPTVFGVWRDDTHTKVMLSTPNGVVVVGVGEGVMGFRVDSIGANTVSLLESASGERLLLSSPAFPRTSAGTKN